MQRSFIQKTAILIVIMGLAFQHDKLGLSLQGEQTLLWGIQLFLIAIIFWEATLFCVALRSEPNLGSNKDN